jgi:hypothetical protein
MPDNWREPVVIFCWTWFVFPFATTGFTSFLLYLLVDLSGRSGFFHKAGPELLGWSGINQINFNNPALCSTWTLLALIYCLGFLGQSVFSLTQPGLLLPLSHGLFFASNFLGSNILHFVFHFLLVSGQIRIIFLACMWLEKG